MNNNPYFRNSKTKELAKNHGTALEEHSLAMYNVATVKEPMFSPTYMYAEIN